MNLLELDKISALFSRENFRSFLNFYKFFVASPCFNNKPLFSFWIFLNFFTMVNDCHTIRSLNFSDLIEHRLSLYLYLRSLPLYQFINVLFYHNFVILRQKTLQWKFIIYFQLWPFEVSFKYCDHPVDKLCRCILITNCLMLQEAYKVVPVWPLKLIWEVIFCIEAFDSDFEWTHVNFT